MFGSYLEQSGVYTISAALLQYSYDYIPVKYAPANSSLLSN
ncbi:hypothetical protein ACFFJX_18785 [Pseudarcicella hirudinis]